MLTALTCIAASAAFTGPSRPVYGPTGRTHATGYPSMVNYGYGRDNNLDYEKMESAKASGIAALGGSLASVPVKASALLVSHGFTGQWEFNNVALAIQLALFGAIYRCVIRSDDNDMARQGCVGGFALLHALSATTVSKGGADVFLKVGTLFGESCLAYWGAAWALEYAFDRGYLRPLPGFGLPRDGYRSSFVTRNGGGSSYRDGAYYRDGQPRYNGVPRGSSGGEYVGQYSTGRDSRDANLRRRDRYMGGRRR